MRRSLAPALALSALALAATPAVAAKTEPPNPHKFVGSESVEPRFTGEAQEFALKPFTITCEKAKSTTSGVTPTFPSKTLTAVVKYSGCEAEATLNKAEYELKAKFLGPVTFNYHANGAVEMGAGGTVKEGKLEGAGAIEIAVKGPFKCTIDIPAGTYPAKAVRKPEAEYEAAKFNNVEETIETGKGPVVVKKLAISTALTKVPYELEGEFAKRCRRRNTPTAAPPARSWRSSRRAASDGNSCVAAARGAWGRSEDRPHGWRVTGSEDHGFRAPRNATLQRRNLVVDLASEVELILILARSREEELNAVATDAVVAREEGRVPYRPDFAPRIVAGSHADDDLHYVSGVPPHRRVVRVVDEVVLDSHRDRPGGMVPEVLFLADDPGDSARFEIDFAVAAREAARCADRRAGVEAPGRNPVDDRDPAAAGRVRCGLDRHAAERQQRRQRPERHAAAGLAPRHRRGL